MKKDITWGPVIKIYCVARFNQYFIQNNGIF